MKIKKTFRFHRVILAALLLGVMLVIAPGCKDDETSNTGESGGGGDGDTFTLSVNGGPSATYVDARDPFVIAVFSASLGMMNIVYGRGMNFSTLLYEEEVVSLMVTGTLAGTYTPSYAAYQHRTLGCFINMSPTVGNVTITLYEDVGGKVQGTFDGVEVPAFGSPCGPFPAGTGTVVLSGAFDATRDPEEP